MDVKVAEVMFAELSRKKAGTWAAHCRTVARIAEKIAEKTRDMDAEKAYVMGLFHDVGKAFTDGDFVHIFEGYRFLSDLGYEEYAHICLSHSFPIQDIDTYYGKKDCDSGQYHFLMKFLCDRIYTDYDKLIQLCDALAGQQAPIRLEERFVDLVLRKGFHDFTVARWKASYELKDYFDGLTGRDIYTLI